ncbi:MAG: MBL fold metallo-hydrolase [Candidatus Roizmanbacteria bacterium]|nr:MBL fold metallo-hydrolase [Candidatus Roizmanbacteria bacterium]
MEIKYLGHSSFRIRGKDAVIITDPFDQKMVGLAYPKTEAQVVTISHEHADHNALERVGGDPVVVRGPGEYEVQGVRIYGYKTFHDDKNGGERGVNTVYLIVLDGIRILHCGDLGHTLSDSLFDEIGDVDILIIPVGGTYTINAKQAASVVKQIEPLIVIPMHYQVPGMTDSFSDLQTVDIFAKELDKDVKPEEKLVITRDKFPQDLELVVLQSK